MTPGTRERVEQVIKESRCIRSREVNGLRKENNSIIDVTDLLSATGAEIVQGTRGKLEHSV